MEQDGLCVKPFTRALCNEGKLLLPTDFSEGLKSCPLATSCVEKDSCANYRTTAINIKWTMPEERKTEKKNFLASLECDQEGDSLCCPEDNQDDILSPGNILLTYRQKP